MNLSRYFLSLNDNIRRGECRNNNEIKYIVITSSRFLGFTARKNRNMIERNKNSEENITICHYIIDFNGDVLNIIPENEIAYATKDNEYDTKSISIMLSLKEDENYSEEELITLSRIIKILMDKYNIKEDDVVLEYDVNRSMRPAKFCDEPILLEEILKNNRK